ncbi:hypothetical protein FKP32DRAFT_1572420 [Trametes sanguinea]|nr:hypothetical protein FKP32DRAFT_1572420 [Trametes sanguinea]
MQFLARKHNCRDARCSVVVAGHLKPRDQDVKSLSHSWIGEDLVAHVFRARGQGDAHGERPEIIGSIARQRPLYKRTCHHSLAGQCSKHYPEQPLTPWTPRCTGRCASNSLSSSSLQPHGLRTRSFVEEYCDIAAFALIFYEYIITIDREIALIWNRKLTGATILFILNRYLALLKYPIYIVGLQSVSDEVWALAVWAVNILAMLLELLPYFVWLSFSTLRVYAISRQNWRLALLVAVPGCMPLASNIYLYTQGSTANYPLPIGCVWLDTIPVNIDNRCASHRRHWLLIATRTSAILTDVLVLITTWWQTYSLRRLAVQANMQVSLATLLVRDGTIYFLVLLAMNTFHIAFSLTGRFTYTITFEEPLTTILISRFLLNLREASMSTGQSSLDMSEPSFVRRHPQEEEGALNVVASFIAPLGALLDHSAEPMCEDVDVDQPCVDDP